VRDRYQPFTITYPRPTLAGWLSAVLGAGLAIEAIAHPAPMRRPPPPTHRSLTPGSPLTSSSCVRASRKTQPARSNVQPAATYVFQTAWAGAGSGEVLGWALSSRLPSWVAGRGSFTACAPVGCRGEAWLKKGLPSSK
jgi:hypothetical protein